MSITMSGTKSVIANFIQPLAITTQPHDATSSPGGTTNFAVEATGSGPLAYQWRFNGSSVPGATNVTLTLANIQSSNAGNYQAVVSGTYDSITSALAVLTVTCPGTNVVFVASDAALRSALAIGGDVRLCFSGTVTITNAINIDKNVTVDGSGTSVIINGGNSVRLFNVSTGVTFMMTNIVLADGRLVGANGTNAGSAPFLFTEPGHSADGAAIYNDGGIVRLFACALRDHTAVGGNGGSGTGFTIYGAEGGPARGAAVFNNLGTVELVGCLLTNNSATGGNGGTSSGQAANGGAGGTVFGGAIFNNGGTVRASVSLLISNSAIGGQGGPPPAAYRGGDARGGAVCSLTGDLTMTNCVLVGNSALVSAGSTSPQATNAAVAQGGAIFEGGGTVFVDTSELRNNVARGGASPVGNIYSIRPGNAAGGALHVQGGAFTIGRSSITANEADGGDAYRHSGTGYADGGAIYNAGQLRVIDTQLSANRSMAGSYSSVNSMALGGALYNAASTVITGTTLDNNTATGGSGGSFGTPFGWPGADAFGGGIFSFGTLGMTNCTLALNTVQWGKPRWPRSKFRQRFRRWDFHEQWDDGPDECDDCVQLGGPWNLL